MKDFKQFYIEYRVQNLKKVKYDIEVMLAGENDKNYKEMARELMELTAYAHVNTMFSLEILLDYTKKLLMERKTFEEVKIILRGLSDGQDNKTGG